MNLPWRAVGPYLGAALLAAGWLLAVLALVWLALEEPARAGFAAALLAGLPMLVLGWLVGALLLALAWRRWVGAPAQALARLAEQVRVRASAADAPALQAPDAGLQPLAAGVQALVTQRDELRASMSAQVAQASARVQQEKDRLAALVSELHQSVVVCNLDGRVLLYNQQARQQFQAPQAGTAAGAGAGLLGIGRSIHGLIERAQVEHALDGMRRRLARGIANPAVQFVARSGDGQLLRVQVAPVLAGAAEEGGVGGAREISGFVLLLDDVTRSFAEETARDRVLHELTEGSRASLANIRAAVEMLGFDDVEPAMRERFLAVVREETTTMATRIDALASRAADEVETRWPLQDMPGSDFVAVAAQQIQARTGCPVTSESVTAGLWLRIDSYSLLQALAYLAHRLVDEFGVRALQLRLEPAAGARVHLDLAWTGHAMSTETVMSWELDPMQAGGDSTSLTVRDVVTRHDGEMWFERERRQHLAFFRFLLPQGGAHEAAADTAGADRDSRPEYYDFDLFQREPDSALDERPLAGLRYTVFDTETTGLDPAGGDRIIQFGAVRIVNGRVLAHETFNQLVDPGRDIPEAGSAIHGITPAMVAGQPRIEAVLPRFHAFAEDSVLVGHNAAFDLRFLQLLEAGTGVVFRQPVLDTLLLSAVVHPNQGSHRLEEIAARLGVAVQGRHTALGDALVTAEVWLRLIPLLEAQGIHTLRQAREAAQQTFYARLKY
ncbi:MAG TPA: 3'-5' exonuclease [Ottowia sp.]|uniref:3'-5' exonuclease n=1 Tax=Ottowia sp. TaxID=1898956 RepID=UPI002CBD1B4B|nr:3'-5' exonuclease [Ottowia sp.]HMN22192.1 3'-5' exonuclease [Ottowia sp.]